MKTILMVLPNDNDGRDKIFREIKEEIEKRNLFALEVVHGTQDIKNRMKMNMRICCVIYDWDNGGIQIANMIEKMNNELPIFTFSLKGMVNDLNLSDFQLNLHFMDYVANTAPTKVDRIEKAIREYFAHIVPPFTKKLFDYIMKNKYPYCTPGHLAGSAFMKSPVGILFYDFYGPNVFKTDVSVSMTELGSLLDHSGPHKEAETFIAKTFNADRSYIVTNGTSTANKIIGMSAACQGETVLMDRNCHKSLTHFLMMTDVQPIYLKPSRNPYGIIGGIPKSEFKKSAILEKIKKANAFAKKHKNIKTAFEWPTYCVITNSTYDGLLYNTDFIKKSLDIKHLHFDSAWVPYTNFSPIYNKLHGMYGKAPKNKIIYESQSTHKLLAAFSQTSMVHVKGQYDEHKMNDAYMMHTSTSPQYSLVASAEMAAAMMIGNSGKRLMRNSHKRAMNFRSEMKKLLRQNKQGWFFDVWQPNNIGETAKCWPLKPNEKWHAFAKVDKDHLYLDPIKITVITPGVKEGRVTDFGIPAAILAKYLDYHGIVVEKTGPYNLLFLFSIGIDKAKSLKLLSQFIKFKKEFDENLSIEKMLPNLYQEAPNFYKDMTIQELAKGIHDIYKKYRLTQLFDKAYNIIPQQSMTPYQAYQQRIKGRVKECELKNLKNKICAEMILPYPPGIPLIQPGEMITDDTNVILEYLLTLCEIGKHYRGFETDIHGLWQKKDGKYYTQVIDK